MKGYKWLTALLALALGLLLAACTGGAGKGPESDVPGPGPGPDDPGPGTTVEASAVLDRTELTLYTGGEATLTATLKDLGDGSVIWTTSDETVVTVTDMGEGKAVVKAVGVGSATVGVTLGDKTLASCEIKTEASPLEIFLPNGLVLKKNGKATVKAICSAEITGDIVWETSDPAIGTVEYQGLTAIVTAVGRGTCTITVRAGDYVASTTLMVGTKA